MSLVNAVLPPDALPEPDRLPMRDARHLLGYPELLNVSAALLDTHLEMGRSNRPAIRCGGRTLTYGLLAERVSRLANGFAAKGIKPGDRVLIALSNIPEFAEAWLAALRIGAVAVATMPMLRRKELERIIAETEPVGLITSTELLPVFAGCAGVPPFCLVVGSESGGNFRYEDFLVLGSPRHEVARTCAEDVALIAYTSGSTSHPKGTVHSHGDVLAIADTYAREVLAPDPEDRFTGHPSLAFTFGLGGLLVFPFRFGASVILEPASFDTGKWLALIRDERPTRLFTTPTACRLLLEERECRNPLLWRSTRTVVSAGQKLPAGTFTRWREATRTKILDGCGSTEMLHIWISQRHDDAEAGCTGRLVNHFAAKLFDEAGQEIREQEAEGIIAIQGPTGCRYWRRPDLQAQTVRDGWTLSGDRFRRDASGHFWHIARTDDMIVSGGYKIAPPEVESVLQEHPAILETAVVGWPDPLRGESIKAFVVLKSSVPESASLRADIREFLKSQIAIFKCPHEIEFVASLPRTSSGKISRHSLRAKGETPDLA